MLIERTYHEFAGDLVNTVVAAKGSALVGFSGSASLDELYASLGGDEDSQWNRVFFFSVDETYTPQNVLQSGTT
jgi:6-phosphogluconolactonase/glucosamine-6-phosphate isomerase/deaminase